MSTVNCRSSIPGSVLFAALALMPSAHALASGKTALDEALCTDAQKPVIDILPEGFKPFAGFIQECRVTHDGSPTAITVIAILVNRYFDKHTAPGDGEQDPPYPVLLKDSRKVVGTLPSHFPEDGPVTTEVTFDEWADDWPRRIMLSSETAAEGNADDVAYLNWNSETESYEDGGG